MGLLEAIEEEEKLLNQEPEKEIEEEEEKEDIEAVEEPQEEEEAEKEEVKQPEEDASAKAFARMRKENAEMRRKIDELMNRIEQPKVVREPVRQVQDPEPDKNKDPVAWFEWEARKLNKEIQELKSWKNSAETKQENSSLVERAIEEFNHLEQDFRQTVGDYDDVTAHFVSELSTSFKKLNPDLTPKQIAEAVQSHVLMKASEYARLGLNPIEELYTLTKQEYGYAPKAKTEERKPDLKKIADNKERSAGMAGARGRSSEADVSPKIAAEMSLEEFARLTPEELKRIEGR